jgi:tetratricopeptide (TPR) repeat protein
MAIGTALCLGKLCVSCASMLGSSFSDAPLEHVRDLFEALDSGGETLGKLRGPEAATLHKALGRSKIEIKRTYEASLRHSHSAGFRETVETSFDNLGEVFEFCVPSGQELVRLRHDPEAIANKVADNAVARDMPFFKSGEGRTILVSLVVLAYESLDKDPQFMAALQRLNWKETFEQLAEIKSDTKKLLVFAEDERRRLGIAEGFVHEMAGRIAADSGLDLQGKMKAVRNAIEIYEKEIAGRPVETNLDDIVSRALARAKEQVDKGQSALARATLDKAARELEREDAERRERFVASVTALRTEERNYALASYDGEGAANAVLALARALHGANAEKLGEFLSSEAHALHEYGHDRGSNVHLVAEITLRRELLRLAASDDERGAAHVNLGNALWQLGERESGTARLEEAVAAYRAALEERTRERIPLDWAMTHNNLGNALARLGERESGTARLEEAVAAYRAALEEYSRERVPLRWASTQNNLGLALASLGERESGTARLEEAVAAYRAALQERTPERVPLEWAMTHNNLGNALARLGERENGTARLEAAVAAYHAALTERTRERVPLQWAMTQNNLGNALATLGKRESGTAQLEEAVAAYRSALEEQTRERVPLRWAMTHNNLGNALQTLGERESGTARLKQAVAAYRAALEERTRERAPLQEAASFGNQGVAMMLIAERTNDGALAETAFQQIQAAVETLRNGGQQPWAAYYEEQLPQAQAIRDRLKGK